MNFFEFIILAILRMISFVFQFVWGTVVFMFSIWTIMLENLAPHD